MSDSHEKVAIYDGNEFVCGTCPTNSYGERVAWDLAHPNLTRAALAAELRWLADARSRYETDVFPSIAREVQTARQLADIIERATPVGEGGAGFGWIPSWLWDEWDEMAAVSDPQRRNGEWASPYRSGDETVIEQMRARGRL